MKGFAKCPSGHYYKEELSACPYCHDGNDLDRDAARHVSMAEKTEIVDDNKTRFIKPIAPEPSNSHTVFGEEVIAEIAGKEVVQKEYRNERKLIGWIVTYSFDKMGADFRIYEGRNVIGRDMECNITVPDKTMSGKHATILFKNGKSKIKDELSSHGTFVNDCDIEDDTIELHDNDIIRMGETVFKFKIALI